MSQRSEILAALKRGERLTPLEARERFGCDRLAARIGELQDVGWPILAPMVAVYAQCLNGKKKRVAEYWLDPADKHRWPVGTKGPLTLFKEA